MVGERPIAATDEVSAEDSKQTNEPHYAYDQGTRNEGRDSYSRSDSRDIDRYEAYSPTRSAASLKETCNKPTNMCGCRDCIFGDIFHRSSAVILHYAYNVVGTVTVVANAPVPAIVKDGLQYSSTSWKFAYMYICMCVCVSVCVCV
jgi:hypothetical protein